MTTTEVIITEFLDHRAIQNIVKKTGLKLKKVSDGGSSGGGALLHFESHGVCQGSIGYRALENLVKAFHKAPWHNPEYAVMVIRDDDNQCYNGVYTNES